VARPGIFIRVCTCKGREGVEIQGRHLLGVNLRLGNDAGCVGRAAGFGDGDSMLGLLRLCLFGDGLWNLYCRRCCMYVLYCACAFFACLGWRSRRFAASPGFPRTLISLSPACLIPLPPHLFSLAIDNPRVSCPSHPCDQTYPMLTGSLVRSLVACQATHRCGRVTLYIHRTGSCVCAYLRHLDAM
jgi:hypothetical protein